MTLLQTSPGSDVTTAATAYAGRPELAIAALLHMMSRFPARRSPAMAEAIVRHLCLVAEDTRLALELRECARALIEDWRAFGTLAQPFASRPRHVS